MSIGPDLPDDVVAMIHEGRKTRTLVDTLRPDHLGAYGYARDTSPAIDALAARGTVFTSAYSRRIGSARRIRRRRRRARALGRRTE